MSRARVCKLERLVRVTIIVKMMVPGAGTGGGISVREVG